MQQSNSEIHNLIRQGASKEAIYMQLLQKGWTIEQIQAALATPKFSEPGTHVATGNQEDASHKTVVTMILVGVILVAAGVFSFVASNWDVISKFTKVAIIIFGMLVAHGAGVLLTEKRHYPKTGAALYLLGTIIYGAGIFLVAQIFNIRANWPDGFILWMLGAFVMGFALESKVQIAFGALLGLVAIVGGPFTILSSAFGVYDPFLLTSTALLIVATLACLFTGWHVRKQMPDRLKHIF